MELLSRLYNHRPIFAYENIDSITIGKIKKNSSYYKSFKSKN